MYTKQVFMKRLLILCTILTSYFFITSCNRDAAVIKQLENIKRVGDSNPKEAMLMLDSIKIEEKSWTEHTRMKCDLLDIRLHDKAYMPVTSDLKIKPIVAYCRKHGNNTERQEAYYYAGSTYRDLKNYPQAIAYFLQSKDLCTNGQDFDTVMLRNTYSNLDWLYYKVQDYKNSTIMSEKEYDLAKSLGILDASTIQNLGASQLRIGQTDKARESFIRALELVQKGDSNNITNIYHLLYHFSQLKMVSQAKICYELVKTKIPRDSLSPDCIMDLGEYYLLTNEINSAVECYKQVVSRSDNLESVYDASKTLFNLYNYLGDIKSANCYGKIFISTSDTLNLGKRQELAATTNNFYQYHRDKKREENLTKRGNTYRRVAFWMSIILTLFVLVLLVVHLYKRCESAKQIHSLRQLLSSYGADISCLKKDIAKQEECLIIQEDILRETQKQLQEVTRQAEQYQNKVKEQERILAEKMDQNRSLMRLMHKAELESSAGDIINTVRETSKGKHKMTAGEWNMLMQAVDEMYPDFNAALAAKLGRIDKNELHVCYLMLIGLTNPQIINVTALPHSTVWRWTKKFEWITTWKSPDMPSVAEKKV